MKDWPDPVIVPQSPLNVPLIIARILVGGFALWILILGFCKLFVV
jgi:hypothetical protein